MSDALVTGRGLVEALRQCGIGEWSADAVRQWIREEPPCPIAAPAQQGAPHRYDVNQVMNWLLERAGRERGKGFTSQAGPLAQKIERELARRAGGGGAVVEPVARVEQSPQAAFVLPVAAAIKTVAAAGDFSDEEIAELTDLELMRNVLRGRDPRNWESAERALRLHRENRLSEGKVIPVEDLENTLATQAIAMRNASTAIINVIAQRIPDQSTYQQRCQILRTGFDEMLNRLANEDTVALASGGAR